MSPNPRRDHTAGRVYNDLRNLARKAGRSTQEVMVAYLLERFLYRLSISGGRDSFVLKGGLLLAQFHARRPTRDIDLLGRHITLEEAAVLSVICSYAQTPVDDGVTFDVEAARAQAIREDDAYAGLRITLPARIAKAELKLQLDISVGDPITPTPEEITYPEQLDGSGFPLLGYPIQTVLAEKLTTALRLGDANTRERDWADVWRLTGLHDLVALEVRQALERTGRHRDIPLRPLSEVIVDLPARRSASYSGWRRKQGVDADAYPGEFTQVVTEVLAFADPLLEPQTTVIRWKAASRTWR